MHIQHVDVDDIAVHRQRDNLNISEALFYLAQESLSAGNCDLAASIVAATGKAVLSKNDFQAQPQMAQFLKAFLAASPPVRQAVLKLIESIETL